MFYQECFIHERVDDRIDKRVAHGYPVANEEENGDPKLRDADRQTVIARYGQIQIE